MQASFIELVGTAKSMAAAETLESIKRSELNRELTGLTPSLTPARPAAMGAQASESAKTGWGCLTATTITSIEAGAEPDLTDDASGVGFTLDFPCISEETRDASGAMPTVGFPCISEETHDASGAMPTVGFPCISEETHDASGAMPTVGFPCISEDSQEASDASMTGYSSCGCPRIDETQEASDASGSYFSQCICIH